MPDDPLPTPTPTPTDGDVPRERRPRGVTCECCESVLAADGAVLKRGDQARKWLEYEDACRDHKKTLEARDARIAELERENAALRRPEDAKKPFFAL